MTTYVPETHVHRPHSSWLVAAIALAGIFVAAIVGYAVAGGFTTESAAPGQDVADRVAKAWATGDAASIAAAYDPKVKVILVYDNTEDVVASNIEELTTAIKGAIGLGNTYEQIGPVAYYESAEDGDVFVASMVEVEGIAHTVGDPLVGFYRVRDGKVTKHVFMDAEHY